MDPARSITFLAFGLCTAWLILVGYVLVLVSRERKIRRDMQNLRNLLEEKERK